MLRITLLVALVVCIAAFVPSSRIGNRVRMQMAEKKDEQTITDLNLEQMFEVIHTVFVPTSCFYVYPFLSTNILR